MPLFRNFNSRTIKRDFLSRHVYQFLSVLFLVLALIPINSAFAETVTWIGSSGSWSEAASWSGGVVPGADDDVVISNASSIVSITTEAVAVKSINATGGLEISGGSISLSAGASSFAGAFRLGGGALLSVSGSGTTATATGAVDLTDGRLEAVNGGVLNFPTLLEYDVSGLAGSNDVIRADGAGSEVNFAELNVLAVGKNGSMQRITASNAAVISFAALIDIYNHLSDEGAAVRFVSNSGGQISMPELSQISSTTYQSFISTHLELTGPVTFPRLGYTQGVLFDIEGEINLPEIGSFSNSELLLGENDVFNSPWLSDVSGSTIDLAAGAILNAPYLSSVTGEYPVPSHIKVAGNAQFNVDAISYFDNTTFDISGGHVFDKFDATNWSITNLLPESVVVKVEGAGSRLDLSSITQLVTGPYGPVEAVSGQYQVFQATNGGVIDFSGLVNLYTDSENSESGIKFFQSTDGDIDLSQLLFIHSDSFSFNRTVRFDYEKDLVLPQLVSAGGTSFELQSNLSLPVLAYGDSLSFRAMSGQSLELPAIQSCNACRFRIEGGFFNAPQLTDISSWYSYDGPSSLYISGTGFFNSGFLSNIDSVSFEISDGAVFNKISATSYYADNLNPHAVLVDGPGSRLDLSSVQSISTSAWYDWDGDEENEIIDYFVASNGGVIDLSGASTLSHEYSYHNNVNVIADGNGSQILFDSLRRIEGTFLNIIARASGSIYSPQLEQSEGGILVGPVKFIADGAESDITLGSFCILEGTVFEELNGGLISYSQNPQPITFETSIFGVRSLPQTGACSGNNCSRSQLFVTHSDGTCMRDLGPVRRVNTNIDVDGIAASSTHGLLGFELIHSTSTGAVTGSRMIRIDSSGDYFYSNATIIGPILDGREIRGASFVGQTLVALDSANDDVLFIGPGNGQVTQAKPVSGDFPDIGRKIDLLAEPDGRVVVVTSLDSGPTEDILGAFMTADVFAETVIPQMITFDVSPMNVGYTGLAWGVAPATGNGAWYLLRTSTQDELFGLNPVGLALVSPRQPIMSFPAIDAKFGDLASVVNTDLEAPGPVTATAVPEGSRTAVVVNWNAYDEVANGGDIGQYRIYRSTSSFTTATAATLAGSVSAGTKSFTVENVPYGVTTYFAVTATDLSGNVNNNVVPVSAVSVDTAPPDIVRNLRATSFEDSIRIAWDSPFATDVAGIKVFVDGVQIPNSLPPGTTSYDVTGLNAATRYSIRVAAFDAFNNQLTGPTIVAATWLNNPSVTASPRDTIIDLSWAAVTPANALKQYRVYYSQTPFTSVTGLSSHATIPPGTTTASITGLSNDVTYYIAVTAINISDGERPTVTPIAAVPKFDTVGPVLSNLTYNGAALVSGASITVSGTVGVTATDISGVSRVEFYSVANGTESLMRVDSGSGPLYSAPLNILQINDGAYDILVRGYDSLNQASELSVAVNVALAPPPAPVITSPVNGFETSEQNISVMGTATVGTTVQILRAGAPLGLSVAVSPAGTFAASIALTEGDNLFTAVAQNRGGNSVPSNQVLVKLDSTIPATPVSLSANSRAGGEIQLRWSNSEVSQVVKFDVYRSTSEFSDTGLATKVNAQALTVNSFADLPSTDGTYFYRVIARNTAGTSSGLSNSVTAVSDRLAPSGTITYASTGLTDQGTGAFATGILTLQLEVSEALLAAPFLSLVPNGGIPTSISLTRIDDHHYRGVFTVNANTPSGTSFAVFSARDRYGNRGTTLTEGASILLDTDGPVVTALDVTPTHPIENNSASPTSVSVSLVLDQAPKDGTIPQFNYSLSQTPAVLVPISNLAPSATGLVWSGSFMLPPTAGQTVAEMLRFSFRSEDELGNIGTTINAFNTFQVYQGDLPPAEVPTGLTALAKPGGKVQLSWNPVAEASSYQLFRKTPAEGVNAPLSVYGDPIVGLNFEDATTADGAYQYALASTRHFNSKEAISAESDTVSVVADSVAPNVPQNLVMELIPQGIRASWLAPAGGLVQNGLVTYSVYRANKAPGQDVDISNLTPILTGIDALSAIDSQPSADEHAYVIIAVDEAGNKSQPSNTAYLNFGLLPVQSISVMRTGTGAPQISWFHSSPSVTSYRLLQGTQELMEGADASFTDAGYNGGDRIYSVIAIDNNNAESIARSILLPAVKADFAADTVIKRGVFNRLNYTVTSASEHDLENVTLQVELNGQSHLSEPFSVLAGESLTVPVVVGGYDDLSASEVVTSKIVIEASEGESVEIGHQQDVTVADDVISLQLETDRLTRGGTGKVRFSIHNNSNVTTEFITALQNGNAVSNEIRLKISDSDGNVFSVTPIKQFAGTDVVLLANGSVVARLGSDSTFTSAWFDVLIPSNVPASAKLELEIDGFHYQLGTPQHVSIKGNGTRKEITFVDAPYSGEITSVTPQTSFGEDILIRGRAVERDTGEPVPYETLNLVLRVGGYEQIVPVATVDDGTFLYRFKPDADDAGVYTVSAVFPGISDRPAQGEFSIGRIFLNPPRLSGRAPRNYEFNFGTKVSAAQGISYSNLRFEYHASDQSGATLAPGVALQLPATGNLTAGESKQLNFTMAANQDAPNSGTLRFRLLSDSTGTMPLSFFDLTFQLSSATPSIRFDPQVLETGVNHNKSVNETIFLENNGLAPLEGAQIALITRDTQQPAPQWIYFTSPASISRLEIGERKQIDIFANPTDSVNEGYYEFLLRVSVPGEAPADLPIIVTVAEDGVGSVLLHVDDIYTGTLDENGQIIEGLNGARVKLQHEDLPTITFEGVTDDSGEVMFPEVPAGRYIVRASSNDHQDDIQYLSVRPGVTTTRELFLVNSVISVEWSVREIAIEDRYEIILELLYETNVPIPVLTLEPVSVQLPDMKKGDVLTGELKLTNHGLLPAFDLKSHLPQSEGAVRFEYLAQVPERIESHERVIIPYKLTAVEDLNPVADGDASGGATSPSCHPFSGLISGRTICINGVQIPIFSNHIRWLKGKICPPIDGGGGNLTPGWLADLSGIDIHPGGTTLPGIEGCVPGMNCRPSGSSPNN